MIPQIKKILYATDLSKNSEYAFYYSVDLAKKYGREIIILHAVEPTLREQHLEPIRTKYTMASKRNRWR